VATSRNECSGFCSDPRNIRSHLRTSRHSLCVRLSRAFSIEGLKRDCLLRMDFLVRDQEVEGSNPFAPTTFFLPSHTLTHLPRKRVLQNL